ncbi:MAG: sodium:solute symporter family protein, partial [Verrucomicrobiae bacterium]|nr:sodium:solute symporter family protein [Verrucomicrobiae bacterium]
MSHFNGWIDGSIVGLYLLGTMIAGVWVRRYVSKVEHFLVAGREMNLYLGIASLAATEFGIITCMYAAEAGYTRGFAGATPGICQAAAMLLIGLTGFCVKPLRASGAMTLPELFEKRFGPGVRWLAGVVIVLGGLLNMGVFLKIGGDFLCAVCGWNPDYLVPVMGGLLLLVAIYTILGGMLSVLITDFLQFVIMSTGLLLVTLLILYHIGWDKLFGAVQTHHGAGGFNPVVHPQMGWSYLVFQILGNTAATLTWQTTISRLLSAKNAETGQKIYVRTSFFFVCRWLVPVLWGVAALALLGPAGEGESTMMAMPKFLSTFLPVGLMGLMVAAMLAADMSTDSSYMLGWGSVIYNDILAPFRKGRWPEKRAIRWNRFIVAFIGVYLFVFGLLYEIKGDVWSYLLLSGSVYLSSMSVLLIGCCYWKRANSWGAIGAILGGALVPIAFLSMEKMANTAGWAEQFGKDNAGIAAFAAAALGMLVGSFIKP